MFDYLQPTLGLSVLSTKAHALGDYLAGLVLISSPWLFNFTGDPKANWPVVVAGVLVLLLATLTDYEGGVFRQLLMTLHLGLDRLMGSLLGASPWLLGFADRIYWPHLGLGLLLLIAGLITERLPAYKKTRPAKKAQLDQMTGAQSG